MGKPPKYVEIVPLDIEPKYDFKKIGEIIKALEYLRNEAKRSGDDDISLVINSAFNICFSAYYTALRLEAVRKPDQTN